MNISGPPVAKAWKAFAHSSSDDNILALVVVHDELEASLGSLKVRRGETSARGHNGIKSVQASLQSVNLGERLLKIGIGIGRPLSREREDVSGFVLGQLTGAEKAKVEGAATQLVGVLEKEVARLGKLY
jgi:peptidyl-tRNA hydrolase, PTH1 family